MAILLFFSIIATFLDEYHWIFSLTVNFREWLLVMGVLLILFGPWITKNRKITLSLTFLACIFHAWVFRPYWETMFQKNIGKVEAAKVIDVLFANLNSQNHQKHRLLNYLKEEVPEIVFLAEVNSSWANEIKKMESVYPHSKAIVQEGNFGMAILSKTPLEVEDVFVDRANMIPAMALSTKSPWGRLNLVLLHAHPPVGQYGTVIRDQYLETLSRKIGDLSSPLLVCGDFNTTPWTYIFKKFLRNSGLDSDRGRPAPRTWPNIFPFPSIPIDHCLSKGLNMVKYAKGPDIGSDHWPLVIQVSGKNQSVASE